MIGSNDLNHIKSNEIGPNDLKSDQIIPNCRFRSFSFLFYLFELIQFIVFEWDQIPANYSLSNYINERKWLCTISLNVARNAAMFCNSRSAMRSRILFIFTRFSLREGPLAAAKVVSAEGDVLLRHRRRFACFLHVRFASSLRWCWRWRWRWILFGGVSLWLNRVNLLWVAK
jgi:hypothetical protein